jgi:hypothetical protein
MKTPNTVDAVDLFEAALNCSGADASLTAKVQVVNTYIGKLSYRFSKTARDLLG